MAPYADNKHFTTTPLTPVTYSSAGNQLIYSDNPEDVSTGTLTYHYGFVLPANTPRDVEFYMNCTNGMNGAGRAGVAIKNTSGSSATITIKGAQKYIRRGSGDPMSKQCADLLLSALTGTTRTISLANNAAVFIDSSTFTFASDETSYKLAYGRYTLTSNQANVQVRTFSGNVNTTPAAVFAVANMAPASSDKHFCGLLGYNQKSVSFPATVGTAFLVGEWWHNNNSSLNNVSEYTPCTPKAGGTAVLAGNFGVIYNLNFTNAAGKNIKLIPALTTGEGCILRSVNGSAWSPTEYKSQSQILNGDCWTAQLGNNSTANVRLIIPGANAGNIKVEVY